MKEAYVRKAGRPVDAGVFDADAEGRALFESKDLAAIRTAEDFAVAVEPRGGAPQPTPDRPAGQPGGIA